MMCECALCVAAYDIFVFVSRLLELIMVVM